MIKRQRLVLIAIKRFLFVFLLLSPFALFAQSVEFTFDNDFAVGSDQAYTGGVSLVYLGDSLETIDEGAYKYYTNIMQSIFSTLTLRDFSSKKVNASLGISQIYITPEEIAKSEPIYNDTPYAGISTLDLSLFARESNVLEHYSIKIGVIGKQAGTQKVQESIHNMTGSENPKGWHNQLGSKITLGAGYLRGVREREVALEDGHTFEAFYSIYGDIGNNYTGIGGGGVLRIGKNMPKNYSLMSGIYNPSYFTMVGAQERSNSFGYAFDVGASLNYIADYYLYREGKRQGYNFYQPRTLLMSRLGASIYIENFTCSMTLFPIFAKENITKDTSWGRLSFGWYF